MYHSICSDASSKSNPSSIPQGYVDSYPGSCGRQKQVWMEYLVEGYHDTRWLTGLWSTQAKVEGTVLKAAWQLGSDTSFINVLLVEPGHTTPFCPQGAPWMVTVCFSSILWEGFLTGDSDRYK